jgi:hypothetical protein
MAEKDRDPRPDVAQVLEPGGSLGRRYRVGSLGLATAEEIRAAAELVQQDEARRDAHHGNAILRVLDRCVQVACTDRGIVACDGQDAEQACQLTEIGNTDMHPATAELAWALSELLDEPDADAFDRAMKATARLATAVASAFEGRPRAS